MGLDEAARCTVWSLTVRSIALRANFASISEAFAPMWQTPPKRLPRGEGELAIFYATPKPVVWEAVYSKSVVKNARESRGGLP